MITPTAGHRRPRSQRTTTTALAAPYPPALVVPRGEPYRGHDADRDQALAQKRTISGDRTGPLDIGGHTAPPGCLHRLGRYENLSTATQYGPATSGLDTERSNQPPRERPRVTGHCAAQWFKGWKLPLMTTVLWRRRHGSRRTRAAQSTKWLCRSLVAAVFGVMTITNAAAAHGDPPPPPPAPAPLAAEQPPSAEPAPPDQGLNPWPDIRYYDQLDANIFAQPGGVWFLSPTGLNCGIWGRGNFGCSGRIPGAPDNVTHIGWINGDRAVHYDWSMAVRFPPTQAQQPLPPRSFITHEGTTCAVTPDNRAYCERGPMRYSIEPTKTWLSAPWMDLSWQVLGPTTSAPK